MIYLSVCSGIEAASVAWRSLGWHAYAYSETAAFPSAVLAHHYPGTPNLGDMTKFIGWPDATINVLVGGTPCQSFSIAGLRKGLADPRGNLMLTYLAIAERYRPQWLVWENVPGVLSSNGGRDFGTLLGGLAKLGYGFAYRVLNAQYIGVPQRRRRVFVVGYFGNWRAAAAVLFERHGLQWHPAPSGKTREGNTGTIDARAPGSNGLDLNFDIAGALSASSGGADENDAEQNRLIATPIYCPDVVPQAMSSKWSKGSSGPSGDEIANLIAFDTTQITSAENRSQPQVGDPCHPLQAHAHAPAIAYRTNAKGEVYDQGNLSATLTSNTDPCSQILAIPINDKATRYKGGGDSRNNDGSGNGLGIGNPGDPCPTLTKNDKHAIAIFKAGQGSKAGSIAYSNTSSPILSAANSGTNQTPAVMQNMRVRRLTPRECERLQGFPDDFTFIPLRNSKGRLNGKWAKDGPRYMALGNSMAVPAMHWIGKRIQQVEKLSEKIA